MNEQGTPAETRIVAICNVQDAGRTCEDALRPDLYYRLAAMKITLPPLRSRGEDILMLFNRFCARFAEDYGCEAPEVSADGPSPQSDPADDSDTRSFEFKRIEYDIEGAASKIFDAKLERNFGQRLFIGV